MGHLGFHNYIIKGMKEFNTEIPCITNCLYALSGLSYNNVKNSDLMAQEGIF